jgi:hypothetical protein
MFHRFPVRNQERVEPRDLAVEPVEDELMRWRLEQLERAGYDRPSAEMLAAELEVDLHEAVELARRGCPPETALRILL